MGTHRQHGSGEGLPLSARWGGGFRMLATLCLLLVAVMSTVQVCHAHPDSRAKQSSRQGDPIPEDHCPLCVAMHSALPANIQVAPEPMLVVRTPQSVAADAERVFRWRFELASRPPPAAGVRLA